MNFETNNEKKHDSGIDLVLTWVDGSDPEWLKEKAKYDGSCIGDKRTIRYRDWDNLKYWFRGVEKYLPWIRKIHFVTWGHLPKWLNTDAPKLNIVRHEDYIPEKYLPTFNSHTIEWNFDKIPGLSEKFIYSNDDMFFIAPMRENDFFERELPKDCALESIMIYRKDSIGHIVGNNLRVINERFNKEEVYKKYWKKWYSIKYGKKNLNNIYFRFIKFYAGFINPHIPSPFLKETFEEIWDKEYEIIDSTCSHKFRSDYDVSQWMARYWQFVTGRFVPGDRKIGLFLVIRDDDDKIENIIKNQKYKMICLSDNYDDVNFAYERDFINNCFDKILPEKSSFEK